MVLDKAILSKSTDLFRYLLGYFKSLDHLQALGEALVASAWLGINKRVKA